MRKLHSKDCILKRVVGGPMKMDLKGKTGNSKITRLMHSLLVRPHALILGLETVPCD